MHRQFSVDFFYVRDNRMWRNGERIADFVEAQTFGDKAQNVSFPLSQSSDGIAVTRSIFATWTCGRNLNRHGRRHAKTRQHFARNARRNRGLTAQQALEYGFVDHLREFATDVIGGGGTDDHITSVKK